MLLRFPDLDTLRLAITSGLVPAEVSAGPAEVSRAGDAVVVDSPVTLPKKRRSELEKLGISGVERHAGEAVEVSCWPQLLPLVRTNSSPQFSSQAPVLFELQGEEGLSDVVSELVRLGNDRQSFRWLAGGRVLLRVIGPPYYTLLRALDRATLGGGVRAFVEVAPRVWIELGYEHPLASLVQVAEGQSLLVRSPDEWEYLADEPFRDVYELLNLRLPAKSVVHATTVPELRIAVPIRLVPGNAADEPEFWVLDGDPLGRLDAFVRDTDERLVRRLRFAVAEGADGSKAAILRSVPSKLAPPPLALPGAAGYRAYWKLPNLFVPAGWRLHPPLRREAIRTLLAPDPAAVVWLAGDGTGFVPYSIPDAAFRKLEDWVEYVIDREREPLSEWVASSKFDFDSFVCGESAVRQLEPRLREPPPDRPERSRKVPRPTQSETEPDVAAAEVSVAASPPKAESASAWKLKRAKLEQSFLAVNGSLDHADRLRLWPELAAANAGAGDAAEAAACWMQALWPVASPPKEWLRTWASAELPGITFPIPERVIDACLAASDPTLAEARQFAAVLLAAAAEKARWLPARLPIARTYFDAHESKLPVRAAWLAACALASLSGSDVLGLARARDRLLARLLAGGLNPDRDLPAFLRFTGSADADRAREVREKTNDLHALVKAWLVRSLSDQSKDTTATPAYADLLFAYAFAKFGDATRARELVRAAERVLAGPAPPSAVPYWAITSGILFRAFVARIEQVLAGVPPVGPFPQDLTDEIAEQLRLGKGIASSPHSMAHYVIARMREQSVVLDAHERIDPMMQWSIQTDEVTKQLLTLPSVKSDALPREVRRLLAARSGTRPAEHSRFKILHDALPLAPRAGEAFTVELLKLVPEAIAGADPTDEPAKHQGALLERSLYFAGHFGRADLVGPLVDRFMQLVSVERDDEKRFTLVAAAAGQGLRSLRKLGQKDAVDRLLQRLLAEVAKGEPVDKLRAKYAAVPRRWNDALRALLRLAGGWLTFGLTEKAVPIVDAARAELLAPGPTGFAGNPATDLARAYVSALGQGPADFGLPRLEELFRSLPPNRILNSWTTERVYSLNHFLVIEDVVLALTGDDFAVGAAGRRWLDEDEFLVRQRIHADVRRQVEKAGL